MPRWLKGSETIEKLVHANDLQKVQGADANGEPLLLKARRSLASAHALSRDDPDSSFTLAYDAARFACTAVLAQQGLRPTSQGGHYAVEQAMRAQFGDGFRSFGALRRRRNELEYPSAANAETAPDELADAHRDASRIVEAAEQLLRV
ncbi:hypothetical protein OHA72_05365 [Dactylosporangium sp. NBC_01737]|uniref:hypothetical protein n=1 Tax=Dactylosporangium sp. NBC_01737 TaxID=2975959 RepID=UPI002E1343D5|nr:hypothetical protein OHA72_05365 [Dactylosporangium sp. NBC_01737]